MSIVSLVFREIRHRIGGFLITMAAVAVAVVAVVGSVALLREFDSETIALEQVMEDDSKARMANLENEIRKSMKGLGFNLYIYPEGQNLGEVYEQGFASKTMPEAYVEKLAASDIVTVNHLLPQLTRKIKWEEQQRTVVLIGVRGEVPIAHRDPKKPLIDPVAEGHVVIGFELAAGVGIEEGAEIVLQGRRFTVDKIHAERGTVDDITIWMNLGELQSMLGMEGQINAILALECNCATIDRIGEIRAELGQLLPGVQIVEQQSKALARAEARVLAQKTAAEQMASLRASRAELRTKRETAAAAAAPLLVGLALVMIAVLALINANARRVEAGVLQALGVTSAAVSLAFLARAVLAAVLGTIVAAAGFFAVGGSLRDSLSASEWGLIFLAATVVAGLAAWIPSLLAGQRDPSLALRHD